MIKNMLFLLAFILLWGCSEDDGNRPNSSIYGTWQLVETIIIDQELTAVWVPVDDGHTYTFHENGEFTSSRFGECSTGNYSTTSELLILNYDCEGFTTEIESPPGTFKEMLELEADQMILTPTYLTCIEGCGYKFKKIGTN